MFFKKSDSSAESKGEEGKELVWLAAGAGEGKLHSKSITKAIDARSIVFDRLALAELKRTYPLRGKASALIIVDPTELKDFGAFVDEFGSSGNISTTRLARFSEELNLEELLNPMSEPNVIEMPTTTEVEIPNGQQTSIAPKKYFYAFSPSLRRVVKKMGDLADNGITRIYLLGGPGAGKTTLAYYYFLKRAKGNFVSVNLNAESTGDKAAMKSLLCGHVTGAFPGASSREGALAFAGDGVCFLDESHGVTGVVMQVLMEVLDSGQFLPFGATKKRALYCSVVFASNRGWNALREMMHLDEHARLGATIVEIPDLAGREEDMLAIAGVVLHKFSKTCATWKAPIGFEPDAWEIIKNHSWRGNNRTLIRVVETAAVKHCLENPEKSLISKSEVEYGLELWEPEDHESMKLYASFKS